MYDTSGTHSVCHATAPDNDIALRIAWLKGEVARAENRAEVLREEKEWERVTLMRSPVTTEDAYAWFGTFLGLFPPFAIFSRPIFGGLDGRSDFGNAGSFWLCLLMAMNAVCCLVGRKFGRVLGRALGDPRAHGWAWHVVFSLLLGSRGRP